MHLTDRRARVDNAAAVVLSIALIVFGGVAVLFLSIQSRRQAREMEHRERLAMIERGIVPPPEVDPAGFEASFDAPQAAPESRAVRRWRSAGVILIGLGLADGLLLAFTVGKPEIAIGVGGGAVVLGGAFFVNSILLDRADARSVSRRPPVPPRSESPTSQSNHPTTRPPQL
jgi:hypothetical protein